MSTPRLAKIWMNGDLVDAETAALSVTSSTVHCGWGVFEECRSYKTLQGAAILNHRAHTERLLRASKIMGLSLLWTADQIMSATKDVIGKNKHFDANIRMTVVTGSEHLERGRPGTTGRVMIFTYPQEPTMGIAAHQRGVRICTTPWKLMGPEHFPLALQTTGAQMIGSLARKEALANGYDEALFVDHQGYVQQTCCHDIFIVQDGELVVNLWQDRSGQSVTKSLIIELARNLDIPIRMQQFDTAAMYVADEAFIASAHSGVLSVAYLNGHELPETGPVTRKIMELYLSIAYGKNPRFNHMINVV